MKLDVSDFINFSKTCKKIYNLKNIWLNFLQKDFSFIIDKAFYIVNCFHPEFPYVDRSNFLKTDFYNKSFKDIYSIFYQLVKLKLITKYHINLETFYKTNIFYLPEMKIEKIPKEFKIMKNLNEIVLRNNEITEISQELFEIVKLRKLDLSYNYIVTIPIEISKLTNLKILNLENNQIYNFPKEMENLIKLKELYLQFNKIKKIINLTNLRKLTCDKIYNKFETT